MSDLIAVNDSLFNDLSRIEERIANVPEADRGLLQSALQYLYSDNGPVNLQLKRMEAAEQYLDPAERMLIRWLYARTNGKLRDSYGSTALIAARAAKYRCEKCGFSDIRALTLDRVNGRVPNTPFSCLCANCRAIKSRSADATNVNSKSAELSD